MLYPAQKKGRLNNEDQMLVNNYALIVVYHSDFCTVIFEDLLLPLLSLSVGYQTLFQPRFSSHLQKKYHKPLP